MELRTTMRVRGMVKLIALIVIFNQVLTSVFSFACHAIDPGVTPQVTSIFGLASSLLLGFWLQADARSAYRQAVEKGFIVSADKSNPFPRIGEKCPKKWLVVLHIELYPVLVGL
jgi:hypothetical protein